MSAPLYLILPHNLDAKDTLINSSHAIYRVEHAQVMNAPKIMRTIESELVHLSTEIRIMLQHPFIYHEDNRVEDFFSILQQLSREDWLDCYVAFEAVGDTWQDSTYQQIERYELRNHSRATRRLDLCFSQLLIFAF